MTEKHVEQSDYLERPETYTAVRHSIDNQLYRAADVSDQVANILGNWPFLDKTRKLMRIFITTTLGLPRQKSYSQLQDDDGKKRIRYKHEDITNWSFLNSDISRYLLDNCINREYYEEFPVAVWTYLFSTFDEILRGMYFCTSDKTTKISERGEKQHSLQELISPKKIEKWCKAQGSKRKDPVNLIMQRLSVFTRVMCKQGKNPKSNEGARRVLEGDLTRCQSLQAVKNCYQELSKLSEEDLEKKLETNPTYFATMLHAVQFVINQSFLLARDPDRVVVVPKNKKSRFVLCVPKYQINMMRGGVRNFDELIIIMTCFAKDVFQEGPRFNSVFDDAPDLDATKLLLSEIYKMRVERLHDPWLHLECCNRLQKFTNKFDYESKVIHRSDGKFEMIEDEKFDVSAYSERDKHWLASEYLQSAFLALIMQDPENKLIFGMNFGLMAIMANVAKIFSEVQVDLVEVYGCNVTSMSYLLLAYHHWIDHHDNTQDIDKRIILALITHIDEIRSRLIKENGSN